MSELTLDPIGCLGVSVPWGEFAAQTPELADFGALRLGVVPAYLATVGDSGVPRVHPVTPIIGEGCLFVFMQPTSPKGHDIVRRGVYALHCRVPDANGAGGEFYVRGQGERIDSRLPAKCLRGQVGSHRLDRRQLGRPAIVTARFGECFATSDALPTSEKGRGATQRA
jgi:hypothetical protein